MNGLRLSAASAKRSKRAPSSQRPTASRAGLGFALVAAALLPFGCGQDTTTSSGSPESTASGGAGATPSAAGGTTSQGGAQAAGGTGGTGGGAGPLIRNFVDVSSKSPFGLNEWLAGAGSDLAQQGDGSWWRLHVPFTTGPGLQIWVSDKSVAGGRFINRTKAMLPSAAGFPTVLSSGLFIDLNNDGWDDILLLRDQTSFDAKGYLYNPQGQHFDPLPFNVDHDGDNALSDGIAAFFGNKDVSYHTLSARRIDIDDDGDDDLFVARRFGNYLFENLTDTNSWTLADCLKDKAIVQRFRRHNLDRLAIDKDGPAHEWIVNEVGLTRTHTSVRFNNKKAPFIAAADGICSGSFCSEGRGQGPQRWLHLYGLRDPNINPCAPNNGLCEEGEIAKNDPDCLGDYAATEEMSCTFIDHLRRPIAGMNAASIVAVDLAKDGSPNDLVVFGTASAGPNPGSDGKNSEILKAIACTENPAGCQPLTTLGPSLALAHQSELNYGPASPLPSPFNAPFQMIDGATAVDSNGDGTLEIAVFAGRTPFGDSFMHLFEPQQGSWKEASNQELLQDFDRSFQTMHAADLNGDGCQSVVVSNIRGQRIYQAAAKSQVPQLRLKRRLPTFSQNMGRPLLSDVDGDGDLDMVVKTWADTDQDKALMLLLHNDGSGGYELKPEVFKDLPVGLGGTPVAIDFDGDGDLDILASQKGPMLLLENRAKQGEPLTFLPRPDLLPPYYALGGTVHGRALPACEPNKGSPLGGGHCGSSRLEVTDLNGDGKPDVLIVQRKGSNDVLFNNIGGTTCAAKDPGCARQGFISARSDLGITEIFGANEPTGSGQSNRADRIYATGPLLGDQKPTVVVLSAPFVDATTSTDALYLSQITAPLPHGNFCDKNEDCAPNESCASANGFPTLRVCRQGSAQNVVGGWFSKQADAFPLRGGASPVAPFSQLGCSTVGDINGDGHLDVALASNVGETYPDLNNAFVLRFDNKDERCALFNSDPAYTPCDVYFECKQNRCEVHNPEGLGVGGPSKVFADTDPRCCVEKKYEGPISEPPCLSLGRSHPDRCSVRGYLYRHAKAELRERLTEIFFYIWNPDLKRFDEYQHPLDVGEISGSEIFGCSLNDLDQDGDLDLTVTGYVTGAPPDQLLASRQLLTKMFYARRRRFRAINTSIWLNPNWQDSAQLGKAFVRGAFSIRAGKDYGVAVGDVDGDQALEIVINDANGLQLFDDDNR